MNKKENAIVASVRCNDYRKIVTPSRRLQAKGDTYTLQTGKYTNTVYVQCGRLIKHPDLMIKINAFRQYIKKTFCFCVYKDATLLAFFR